MASDSDDALHYQVLSDKLLEALQKIQALAHEGTARLDYEVRVEIEAIATAAIAAS